MKYWYAIYATVVLLGSIAYGVGTGTSSNSGRVGTSSGWVGSSGNGFSGSAAHK